jgi:hypothetical protein
VACTCFAHVQLDDSVIVQYKMFSPRECSSVIIPTVWNDMQTAITLVRCMYVCLFVGGKRDIANARFFLQSAQFCFSIVT